MFAIVAAHLSKLKIKNILKTVHKIKPIKGRFEKIGNLKNNSNVILDYAHTPNALETAILDIKEEFPLSKISLVFGCGGNRDKDKRSLMGNVASKYSDFTYLTDDNPRFENPKSIRSQIKKSLKKNQYIEIASRAEAISTAIKELKSGDVLIVAGKGHENYQEFEKRKYFSDRYEILKAIKKKFYFIKITYILRECLNNSILNKNTSINSVSLIHEKLKEIPFSLVLKEKFDEIICK